MKNRVCKDNFCRPGLRTDKKIAYLKYRSIAYLKYRSTEYCYFKPAEVLIEGMDEDMMVQGIKLSAIINGSNKCSQLVSQ